jgi:proteasome activator subunit 4
MFGCGDYVSRLLSVAGTLISEPDKFKQRAGAEMLTGLLRGIKHWAPQSSDQVWNWTKSRLDIIHAQIKPDTSSMWQCVFHVGIQPPFPHPIIQMLTLELGTISPS